MAAPVPVPVVDLDHLETGPQHQRVRDHGVVLGIRVLLDVQVLLDLAAGIRQEGPLGAEPVAEVDVTFDEPFPEERPSPFLAAEQPACGARST
jgi:hypothetical protein